jgi:hypothetical protein
VETTTLIVKSTTMEDLNSLKQQLNKPKWSHDDLIIFLIGYYIGAEEIYNGRSVNVPT